MQHICTNGELSNCQIHTNKELLNCGLKKALIRIGFLVVFMYGASLVSAFYFCDTFWQISSMCLLNFNLQSKVAPRSFSLRELFMCKSPTLSVLGSCLFKSRWHLSVFSLISLFQNQFKMFSPTLSGKAPLGKIFFGENYSSPAKYFATFPRRKFSPVIFESNHFWSFYYY